jgi:hypothetical protein
MNTHQLSTNDHKKLGDEPVLDARMNENTYKLANEHYTEAIQLNEEYAEAYLRRAKLNHHWHKIQYRTTLQPNEMTIIEDYIYYLRFALKNNLVPESMNDSRLYSIFTNYKKETLFNDVIIKIIQSLPNDKAISFLQDCLDKKTLLGRKFWEQETFLETLSGCSSTHGALEKINNYLKKLSAPAVSIVSKSVFNNNDNVPEKSSSESEGTARRLLNNL